MVVLAYSGGLDTSVAIRWLQENYGYDVIALSVDLGESKEPEGLKAKALAIGAKEVILVDAKAEFAEEYLVPALFANALYEGTYPLATALARPLIVKHLVATARSYQAQAVAHGCTGKGNDQVRFDVGVMALAPDLRVVAPVREWAWSREEEIAYAESHGIPVPATVSSPYSVDANLWGRSVEGGILEDPWMAPPEECFQWTAPTALWPAEPEDLVIGFEEGIPVSLNGEALPLVPLISRVGEAAGRHGIGRIDHVEDRLVGIKSREVYEAPAATVLIGAHQAAESLTLPKDVILHKAGMERTFSQLVYDGLWYGPLTAAILAYLRETQRRVTAEVRMRLFAGRVWTAGRRSPLSLYQERLATYGNLDAYDAKAATGFIQIWGLPLKTLAAEARRG